MVGGRILTLKNMSKVFIAQHEMGLMGNFVYFFGDPETKKMALVYPAWEADRIWKYSRDAGWLVEAILLTHQHFDHINAVPDLLKEIDVPVFIHSQDLAETKRQIGEIRSVGAGDRAKIGNLDVTFIHTPGHTPGSQCFLVEGNIITGDTLFGGSIGRTDLPGGSARELFESLQRLKTLPDETVVYPGHNYGATPTSTIGEEKRTNPFMIISNVREFVRMT